MGFAHPALLLLPLGDFRVPAFLRNASLLNAKILAKMCILLYSFILLSWFFAFLSLPKVMCFVHVSISHLLFPLLLLPPPLVHATILSSIPIRLPKGRPTLIKNQRPALNETATRFLQTYPLRRIAGVICKNKRCLVTKRNKHCLLYPKSCSAAFPKICNMSTFSSTLHLPGSLPYKDFEK